MCARVSPEEQLEAQIDNTDPLTKMYIRSVINPEPPWDPCTDLRSLAGRVQKYGRTRRGSAAATELGVTGWKFNALRLEPEQLVSAAASIFEIYDFLNVFTIPESKLTMFLITLCSRYKEENSYHTFRHAVDVCHVCYRMLALSNLDKTIPRLEVFALLIAALGHDVGHLGVNNAYLTNTMHDLALQYNDISPLENMHCALLFEILMCDGCDILTCLPTFDRKDARKIIISAILSTDMRLHAQCVSKAVVITILRLLFLLLPCMDVLITFV